LRERGRIYVLLELFDCAVEDFTHALEHGAAKISITEMKNLKAELKKAELERDKGKDYYSILSMSKSSICMHSILI
jgi:DnaJ family protein C protein 7